MVKTVKLVELAEKTPKRHEFDVHRDFSRLFAFFFENPCLSLFIRGFLSAFFIRLVETRSSVVRLSLVKFVDIVRKTVNSANFRSFAHFVGFPKIRDNLCNPCLKCLFLRVFSRISENSCNLYLIPPFCTLIFVQKNFKKTIDLDLPT
jgi:hypothetical protein